MPGCVLTAFCLITNIMLPESIIVCPDEVQRRGLPQLHEIHVLDTHANFTFVDQTNAPASGATIQVSISSDDGCPVAWSGVAEGVPSNTPNPVTTAGATNYLVHDSVDFGGDWLNYRVWVNDTSCNPKITEVEIFYEDEDTPCACPPDPLLKPEVFGICSENMCDRDDAEEELGENYPCVCGNTTYDRCGTCGGNGNTCPDVCCERTDDILFPAPLGKVYNKCPNEETVLPMANMCYSVRSVFGDIYNTPPAVGLRVGELTCDFSHPTSQIVMCVNETVISFLGDVWCGFDSEHSNHHQDGYEPGIVAHSFFFNMTFSVGVTFSDTMVTVVDGAEGEVSDTNCGTLTSKLDPLMVAPLCAKTKNGLHLKINDTSIGDDFGGIVGNGWFMNQACNDPCDYCGLSHNAPDDYGSGGVVADLSWCDPGDWFFVVEKKCVPPPSLSQSRSQSISASPSESASPSDSQSRSRSASPSDSQSQSRSEPESQSRSASASPSASQSRSGSASPSISQSRSLSHSASVSTSPQPCCDLAYLPFFPLFIPENRTCIGEYPDAGIPGGEQPICFECACENPGIDYDALPNGLNPIIQGCCDFGPRIFNAQGNMTCSLIGVNLGCFKECCIPDVRNQCVDIEEECEPLACCCEPFIGGCPPIRQMCIDDVVSAEPLCQIWFDNQGSVPLGMGMNATQLEDTCQNLHFTSSKCCNDTMMLPPDELCDETASYSQSTSPSLSESMSTSCPPFVPPPDTCDPEEYAALFHADTFMCVCDSALWGPCKLCDDQDDSCTCPCQRTLVENPCSPTTQPISQTCADFYTANGCDRPCLFHEDCDAAVEPAFLETYMDYGLRSHWGWLKNSTFAAADQKKAPPGFGIFFGKVLLDFSHPLASMKLRILESGIHISGHAWGGYDKSNGADNTDWDSWEILNGMPRPREQPWMVDCWYTEGVEDDLSGVWGEPGVVSEENCCTIMPMKDWNDTTTLCAVANEDGWQLTLGEDARGETGIAGWGWLHRKECDDRCDPQGLNPARCGESEIRFVVESECGQIMSPSESVTPKMPCCERTKPARAPVEPEFPGGDYDYGHDYDYDFDYEYEPPQVRRGIVHSQSQSAPSSSSGDGKVDYLVCDPSLARRNMRVGVEYQLRDHFLDDPWDTVILADDCAVTETLGREFFAMGFLHLTASDTTDNFVKLYYTPGQGTVTISGHVMGRFLNDTTGLPLFPPGHALDLQPYHFEVTYNDHAPAPGWHSDFIVDQLQERIPFAHNGGLGFMISERDEATDMAMPVECSELSGGLFYPKAHPELVTYFNATDANVYGTGFVPEIQPTQFLVISASGLGGVQSWSGIGAYVDKSCPEEPQEMSDVASTYRERVCMAAHDKPRGIAALVFDIEGDCCDTDPTPTQGGCTGGNCWGPGETQSQTPQAQSLSQSQSPKGNEPDESQGFPNGAPALCNEEDFNPFADRSYGTITEGEDSFLPEIYHDPSVAYVIENVTNPNDFFGFGGFDRKARFLVAGGNTGNRYFKFDIKGIANREWAFVRIAWYPGGAWNGTLSPNFVTMVGTGPLARWQCGTGGGNPYTECWVNMHAGDEVLYIGYDHTPKFADPSPQHLDLAGVDLYYFTADNCTLIHRYTLGVFAPFEDREGAGLSGAAAGNGSVTETLKNLGIPFFVVAGCAFGYYKYRGARTVAGDAPGFVDPDTALGGLGSLGMLGDE